MRKFIKYIFMAFFVATIFASTEALAVSPAGSSRSGLEGASYLASYNHHRVAMRNVSNSAEVGRSVVPMVKTPSPSSLALFSTALMLLGIGGLARRRGRR